LLLGKPKFRVPTGHALLVFGKKGPLAKAAKHEKALAIPAGRRQTKQTRPRIARARTAQNPSPLPRSKTGPEICPTCRGAERVHHGGQSTGTPRFDGAHPGRLAGGGPGIVRPLWLPHFARGAPEAGQETALQIRFGRFLAVGVDVVLRQSLAPL